MDNIKICEICGLCNGCLTAINTAKAELNNGNKVTLFKEIVHNKTVNNTLKNLGANFTEDINEIKPDTVAIIRAHGEPPQTFEYLNKHNIKFKDCTCVNVKKIHNLTQEYMLNGYKIIIIGKQTHPEVIATQGWCLNAGIIIESEDDLSKLINIKNEKFYLVCQTTFNINKFEELSKKVQQILEKNNCELIVQNTICFAQKIINDKSVELAKNCAVMIVVGGKNSSNTKELFKNVSSYCPSIFIEDINSFSEELKNNNIEINKNTLIGITAGASTLKEELTQLKQLIINYLNK